MSISINKKTVIYTIFGFVIVLFVLAGSFVIAVKTNLLTGKATLTWQENNEADLAGYKVYYGTEPRKGDTPSESGYPDMVDTKQEHTYKFEKLGLFKTYYFSTTAYNDKGIESGFSEEVSKKITLKDIFKK